jgi:copper transporter 1
VLELLRRLGREYDALILRRARLNKMYMAGSSTVSNPSKLRERSYRRISTDDGLSKATDTEFIRKTHPQNDHIITEPVSSMNLNLDSAGAPVPVEPVAQMGVYLPCAKESYRPSVVEHIVRSFMHMLQFAVAYFIMLLAMYFNGYIIICIFVGAFLGSLIFSWEPVSLGKE